MRLLQQFINYFYRYPLAKHQYIMHMGGYSTYNTMIEDQKSMIESSSLLPPVKSYGDGLEIYFLTGKKYLYQTLFCIHSLVKVSQQQFRFILIDDGSFDENLINLIQKQLPQSEIITQETINKNLAQQLPLNLFPVLHQKRKEYSHIKKLTDIHTINGGWKLVLDSDMLFWANPVELISWLQNPQRPIYMYDCEQSYGYSATLMQNLCGSPIPDRVNVGVIGLNSKQIDWVAIEKWVAALEKKEGTSYYLEQAISAMLLSDSKNQVLDELQYIVNPTVQQSQRKEEMLHHYVDRSKILYYKNALDFVN
ncbi:glycosyl transferase [Pedobacter sp. G11]|uniref:glycosyl transferase n=1 Tax=Pedobacter sp. G11 TaxID=2482728 RepID=UPI000F5EBAF2|nr:glycosyl transferase [Pedobacter sp. G11]AZI25842.1 glycosyl transferase [Pedobacter sp. G11]